MSSHHIVRDEQEPALLFWQPGQLTFEQACELLEWSPRVVVAQAALAEVLGWGIKLDAVWAQPAELHEIKSAVAHQAPVALCTFQENGSLSEVLHWLKKMNQQSVNLLAEAAAQGFALLQHLAPLQQLMQVQVLSKGWRYSFFKPGITQKWLPARRRVRLISFEGKPDINSTKFGEQRMSECVQEIEVQQPGPLKITANDTFWLGEQV